MNPMLAPFYQLAYVTNNMDQALAVFRDHYGVPSFFEMSLDHPAIIMGKEERIVMRVALANLEGVQIELIEDKGSSSGILRDALPADGRFAIVFHHVGTRTPGARGNWDAHLSGLGSDHVFHAQAYLHADAECIYLDERARLGHHIKHVWFGPEALDWMERSIPRHNTRYPIQPSAGNERPIANPLHSPFYQFAYVTTDTKAAQEMMRDVYGIPSFFTFEVKFPAVVGGEHGNMALRVSLADLEGAQIEIIEDVGSSSDVYTKILPGDGRFSLAFHHICIKHTGEKMRWEEHVRSLGAAHVPYYIPDTGTGSEIIYTDERKHLGHYIEHVWSPPDRALWLAQNVPYHPTRFPPIPVA